MKNEVTMKIQISIKIDLIIILSMASIFTFFSCGKKMEILFHEPSAAQFDFYICDSMICPDTKSTSVGETIILDIPDLDSKATDIN